jgi:hypothetical protein
MTEDTNNKRLQKTIVLVSLLIVILGIITIATTGIAGLFKFRDTFIQPLRTSQEPLVIILIFALIALYFSGRNLKRIKDDEKK